LRGKFASCHFAHCANSQAPAAVKCIIGMLLQTVGGLGQSRTVVSLTENRGLLTSDECEALISKMPLSHIYIIINHHHGRIAGEVRRVVAPPCPRSTARLQSSPVGRRVESFRSWSSQLFRGRPGARRHVRSGGRLSDTLMCS